MTNAAQLGQVEQWFSRMSLHLNKAVVLAQKLGHGNLSEDDDLFWALAKYAENVQECIVQLDNMSDSILKCLVEFPLRSDGGSTNWTDLKGMRSRLAHNFWSIHAHILWETVTTDFVELKQIISSLSISTTIGDFDDQPRGAVSREQFLELSPTKEGESVELGNSLPFLYFDSHGLAQCFRLGRTSDNRILVAHSKPGTVRISIGYISDTAEQ